MNRKAVSTIGPIASGMIIFGLFAFSFLYFALLISNYNNPDQSIFNGTSLGNYYNNLSEALDNSYSSTASVQESLSNSTIGNTGSQSGQTIEATAGTWKLITTTTYTVYQATSVFLLAYLFSGPASIVLTALGAIFILIVVLAVIRLVVRGEGT